MTIAGIDFSTRAIDIVLLDETTDRAEWHRFELTGQDAFERTRRVRDLFAGASLSFRDAWESALAFGIEEPRGYGAGSLYRIQGALLTKIPRTSLVQPWIPSAWRKQVGLNGRASKDEVRHWAERNGAAQLYTRTKGATVTTFHLEQDVADAYCIALATRQLIQQAAA